MLCLAVQLYYYFFYFKNLEKYENQPTKKLKPKTSVLVCAHNEEKNIKNCVDKILNQEYDDFELVIVNDRSTDKTSEIINSIKNHKLKIVTIENCKEGYSPKKNAITKGIERATGEYILLTDADCVPSSYNWITRMNQAIDSKTELVLGFSPYQSFNTWLNKLIQFDTFVTAIQYLSFALRRKSTMGVGRNLLIKKSAFERVEGFKGFEKILAGDDDIIVQKISNDKNVSICVDKESFMVSQPKTNWKEWFSQKRRHLVCWSELQYKKCCFIWSFSAKFCVDVFNDFCNWNFIIITKK